jgi:hypothetical protein
MNVTLPEWVDRVKTVWLLVGSIILATGLNLGPLDGLFTQKFIDVALAVVGAVITFVQFFRKDTDEGLAREATALSAPNKTAFALNPFKLRLRRPA